MTYTLLTVAWIIGIAPCYIALRRLSATREFFRAEPLNSVVLSLIWPITCSLMALWAVIDELDKVVQSIFRAIHSGLRGLNKKLTKLDRRLVRSER